MDLVTVKILLRTIRGFLKLARSMENWDGIESCEKALDELIDGLKEAW
jgi:hypothetical protein